MGLDGKVDYLFEGIVYNAGSSIQWLRDEMGFIEESSDSEHFAEKVPTSSELYMVPAFTGFAAPYWDPYARGVIVGLTRGTDKNNIIRATSESLGYQTKDLIDALNEDMGEKVQILKVDGGACRNNLITQFTSDIIGIPVERPENVETTAAGAAYLAGLAVGYWKSKEDIVSNRRIDKVFKPIIDENERAKLYKGWKRAVKAALAWSKDR